jgi:hypothetical protein
LRLKVEDTRPIAVDAALEVGDPVSGVSPAHLFVVCCPGNAPVAIISGAIEVPLRGLVHQGDEDQTNERGNHAFLPLLTWVLQGALWIRGRKNLPVAVEWVPTHDMKDVVEERGGWDCPKTEQGIAGDGWSFAPWVASPSGALEQR